MRPKRRLRPFNVMVLSIVLSIAGWSPALACDPTDPDGDGWSHCDGDTNNGDPNVHPGALEVCDGQDNDGDGELDEGCWGDCDWPDSFGSATHLTDSAGASSYPSLAWNGDGFGVAWLDERDGNREIYLARANSAGERLGADVRVTTDSGASEGPQLVWTGTEYGLAWQDDRNGHWDIYFARYDAAGNPVGTPTRVTDDAGNSFGLGALVWTGTEYAMAFRDNRHGNWEIFLARLNAAGVKLAPETRVTNNTSYSASPSLVWTGNGYGLTWNDIPASDWEVYFVGLDANGATVTPERRVTDVEAASWYPSLAWTGTLFGLVWRDERNDAGDIYFITLDADGLPLTAEERITDDAGTSQLPRLAWQGRRFSAVWYDNRHGNNELYIDRLTDYGTEVFEERRLTADSGDSRAPSVVWTGEVPAVAWSDFRAGDWEIHLGRVPCCPNLDSDPDSVCAGDTNDGNPFIGPSEDERCDGMDTDADGLVDEVCDGFCDAWENGSAGERLTDAAGSSTAVDLHWFGGNAHFIGWQDDRDGDNEIYLAGVEPTGELLGSWTGNRVTDNGASSEAPQVAWTMEEGAVAWQDDRNGDWDIYFRRYDNGGNPLTPELRITDNPGRSYGLGEMVWTGSEYALVWRDDRDGNWEIYFARVDRWGNKIGQEKRITNNTSYSASVDLAWTGDGFGVVWNDIPEDDWEIHFVRLDPLGNVVGAERRITDVAAPSSFPALIWAEDRFGLTWQDERHGGGEIYFIALDGEGSPLTSEIRVTDDPGESETPDLTWSGDEFVLTWYDDRDGNDEIYLARLTADGVKFVPDKRVTQNGGGSRGPSVAWTGDLLGVTWHDFSDGNWEVYYMPVLCCDDVDRDEFTDCHECDDTDPDVFPGAPQYCDGLNTDCDHPAWPDVPEDEDDADSDGYVECEPWVGSVPGIVGGGDCVDFAPLTYPGCVEVNNGIDDQCPGYPGSGLVDEISGPIGFFNQYDPNWLMWTHQEGASFYEVARSTAPDFITGGVCDLIDVIYDPYWIETETPPVGFSFCYLVHASAPFDGSWGADSIGVERLTVCP